MSDINTLGKWKGAGQIAIHVGHIPIDQSVNPKYVPNMPMIMLAIAAILLNRVVVDPINILRENNG